MEQSGYVIITPAHNEEGFIRRTAESVLNQNVRPLKWVVVNDASADHTREIIGSYADRHAFIELVDLDRSPGRHFGNKVRAFAAGFERIRELPFELVGNLDADVSFGPAYFEKLLGRFQEDSRLGLAGGMIHSSINGEFVSQEVALDSVAGAVQLFRRECFEQIGGYHPLPEGGIDAAAEISARMHGWKTRTFPELAVREHRRTGSATARPLASRLREGRRMHSLGYSPLFFLVRCVYRLMERPIVVGSAVALWGYSASVFNRRPVVVSPELVRFLRNEQRGKLKRLVKFKTA